LILEEKTKIRNHSGIYISNENQEYSSPAKKNKNSIRHTHRQRNQRIFLRCKKNTNSLRHTHKQPKSKNTRAKNNNNTKSLRYIHEQRVSWLSKNKTHTNDGGEYNTKLLNHIECPYLECLKYIFVI